jgi:hypothetical protein
MLYREVLLELGEIARTYLSELSHRQRGRLGDEVLEVYALYERRGAAELLAAMELAHAQGAYGVAYLRALVSVPSGSSAGLQPLLEHLGLHQAARPPVGVKSLSPVDGSARRGWPQPKAASAVRA